MHPSGRTRNSREAPSPVITKESEENGCGRVKAVRRSVIPVREHSNFCSTKTAVLFHGNDTVSRSRSRDGDGDTRRHRAEQIRIASGEDLQYKQTERADSRAFDRMPHNAEDPKHLSLARQVTAFTFRRGRGRVDTAVYPGYVVPPYYDSHDRETNRPCTHA